MKFYSKQSQESKSLSDDFKQTLSAAVNITTKPILSKPDAVELEDADPDILEKKREEIRKELELQMKMDSRRIASRKRKHAESSSSSSSSSDSDSSSTSSSSSSSDNRHKSRKLKSTRRDSSSSSDEYAKKLAKKKRACQSKKEALKLHKLSKKHEITVSRKSKKRSPSPLAKKHRSAGDSSSIMLSPSGQKVMVKNLKISTSLDKHHRVREKEIDRSELLQRSERERLRMRSRSPKMTRSRTPKNSPSLLRRSPTEVKRNRSLSRRMDSGEHERREKERELAREKERREALLRSQERQRERERLAAKDSKSQRLLPRPAERASMQAMALAAAQERNTDKDVGYNNRSFGSDRPESFEHRRHEKEPREHDRYEKYESHGRREPSEYQHGPNYRRDWHDESSSKDLYDRSTEHQSSSRDWDHKRNENIRAGDYAERKDWNDSSTKWTERGKPTEKYERRSGQNEYIPHSSSRSYPERAELFDTGSTSSVSKAMGVSSGGIRGRWSTSWRGRGRGTHHHNSDFRRPHHHTEILEERGEIYRRHINPQGVNLNKSATTTKSDTPATVSTPTEKQSDDISKQSSLMADGEDGEEIADDLSEISDEADDILGQQEDTNTKSQQAIETVVGEKLVADVEMKETAVSALKDSVHAENDKSIDPNDSVHMRENITPTKSPEEPDRTKELCDDIDLDFEEISDGELEEEARTKGLGDALGVDWASLVEESKAMMREKLTKIETSAKQRWNPDQILLDVGVSFKMAGTAFAQQTLMTAYENIRRELKCSKIKIEPNDDSNYTDTQVKIEPENDIKVPNVNGIAKEDRKLILHPLPCVQTSIQNTVDKQRQLVFSASGPYSRGLCCKRDIELRRKLCNLSVCESNCKAITTKTGYENNAISLFQKVLQA
ncbi:fl(2)d-associated complex component-like isoform X2 [Contarinia nasturtii]|uniref:fl(2)d-associated complex component-like isoform X2 n=1 Tax=Contarinia nasturtii TaxID=265458 RepID=UPI0012D4401B|nr:fl(2)d-associated complex component-like isoform X2 [Contarinia nasturtii]